MSQGPSPDAMRAATVLGVSGRTAAGKTTVATLLSERGFAAVSFRTPLVRLLQSERVEPTREALRSLGAQIRQTRGQRWLHEQVAGDIASSSSELIVVDGLRFPEDHEFLANAYAEAFFHIHVVAPEGLRRKRFHNRGGSEAEFAAALTHETEASIELTGRLAHVTVLNDSSVERIREQLQELPVRAKDVPKCQ